MAENSTLQLEPITIIIELMGRPFQVRCPAEEIADLKKAATYLDSTMKTISANKLYSPEKITIMSALTLASHILKLEDQANQHMDSLHQRLGNLQNKLEYALEPSEPFLTLERQSAEV